MAGFIAQTNPKMACLTLCDMQLPLAQIRQLGPGASSFECPMGDEETATPKRCISTTPKWLNEPFGCRLGRGDSPRISSNRPGRRARGGCTVVGSCRAASGSHENLTRQPLPVHWRWDAVRWTVGH